MAAICLAMTTIVMSTATIAAPLSAVLNVFRRAHTNTEMATTMAT